MAAAPRRRARRDERIQRDAALALVAACLSDRGFATARDVMRLNHVIGEVTGRWEEYGEWLYWLSVMGTPSATGPWGWQIDGHHLIVNCLVVGDQLVMTPMFMGSEPVHADSGQFAGTRVFAAEEAKGLALMRALTPDQRAKATIGHELPIELFTAAFRDNVELRHEGIRWGDLARPQQEVQRHLDDTWSRGWATPIPTASSTTASTAR